MATSSTSAEELPLLIQDYSCANSFEEHVRAIEVYLTSLFDTEPLLQSFLVVQSASIKSTRSSPSPILKHLNNAPSGLDSHGSNHIQNQDNRDDNDDGVASSPSLVTLLDDSANGSPNTAVSNVFSRRMTLYALPPSSSTNTTAPQLNPDLSIAVEVHVRDDAHLITQQYCTPLFFLIRKVTTSAAYRESETNYLLSLLSTAVRQVLRQQKNGAVLRIGAAAVPPASTMQQLQLTPPFLYLTRFSKAAADTLPSPFFFPDGCAPCFAPAGDSYKQSFVGVAPPLPTISCVPPAPPPAEVTAAEWTLLHQRSFTTRFLSDAFPHPPEHCKTLSDFIDLFQLHVGQHSRIRSDDFEGICVSMWQVYALPIPWKFNPHGPPASPGASAKREKSSRSAAAAAARKTKECAKVSTPLTWDAVLKRENAYTQLLSGTFTHQFGTSVPPLKHVLFHFQWNQLQDVEAQEPSGRGSHLDPFQFTNTSLSTAAQAAQRKCCITAQAVVRNDDDIEGKVQQCLRAVVMQRYLDPLARCATHSPAPPTLESRSVKKGRSVEGSGVTDGEEAPLQSPTGSTQSPPQAEHTESTSEAEDATKAQLHELVAHIVEWSGANVNLQESLLRRFANSYSPSGGANDDAMNDCRGNAADDEGREGKTHGDVLRAAVERSSTVKARCLSSLWNAWEAHQQLFPITSRPLANTNSTKEARASGRQQQQPRLERGSDTASTSEKDLRVNYFPESFFARFAYTCATQMLHAEDVLMLWHLCLERLKSLLIAPSDSADQNEDEDKEKKRKESWQRLLDFLALPLADPPVDLSGPLITQKFQLLRFALYALLHPSEVTYPVPDANIISAGTAAEQPSEENSGESLSPHGAVLRLITNGEVLVAPAPLPTPPTTADLMLQRAMELNTFSAAAVDTATTAWLQGDALYNDMCLFLFVNMAQEGRVVRFPDFVHWHSPRDFIPPAASNPDGDAATRSDNDYLSDRMKDQPDGGRGSVHVWWSLWRRAVPRPREAILRTLFHPFEEATRVLDWLVALPEATLLLELSNACVANALHQLMCHRFLLGDPGTCENGVWPTQSSSSGSSESTSSSHTRLIPASPRLRSLHRYVQAKCTSLTKDLEAASAVFLSRPDKMSRGGENDSNYTFHQLPSEMEAMELEMLRTFMANALRGVGEIEVGLCVAIALHYLLGFAPDAEAAATVRALCAPLLPSQSENMQQQPSGSSLQMRTVTVSKAAWTTWFAKQFVQPESHTALESMVRLTCMAERPLNTCGCFQQLVVHQDAKHTLRMALALSKEVL